MKRPDGYSYRFVNGDGYDWEGYATDLEKYADWLEEQLEEARNEAQYFKMENEL
jgi:hypothetical protein